MGMGMKSLKWEGIGTKNLFPHTSSSKAFSRCESGLFSTSYLARCVQSQVA